MVGTGPKAKFVKVRLDEAMHDELQRRAVKHERSLSAEIRLACRLWIQRTSA